MNNTRIIRKILSFQKYNYLFQSHLLLFDDIVNIVSITTSQGNTITILVKYIDRMKSFIFGVGMYRLGKKYPTKKSFQEIN